jgi:hypothetical protein
MSSNDSGPPAQRRRKLVLRKIPNLGPLPVVRPPQKSIPFISFELSADAEAAAAITSSPSQAGPLPMGRADEAEAWTGAGHAFAHPASSLTQAPLGAHRAARSQNPASDANPYPMISPASDANPHATMAPVVASSIRLPAPMPMEQGALLLGQATLAPRRSSTLLAVGGSIAGVVLAATLGVAVGERTARPTRTSATMQAVSPATEVRPATSVASAARGSQTMAAPALAAPVIVQLEPTTIGAPPFVHEAITTAVTGQPARAPATTQAATVPAEATRAPAVSAPPAASSSSNRVAGGEVDTTALSASAAAMVPEIPPSPPPAVDPLVQAVREDIREEQTHAK